VLADIVTKLPTTSGNVTGNSGHQILSNGVPDYYILIYKHQWVKITILFILILFLSSS
jgi:hypothetical protein